MQMQMQMQMQMAFSFFSGSGKCCSLYYYMSPRHSSCNINPHPRCKQFEKKNDSCAEFTKPSNSSATELWARFIPAEVHVQMWPVCAVLSGSRTGPTRYAFLPNGVLPRGLAMQVWQQALHALSYIIYDQAAAAH